MTAQPSDANSRTITAFLDAPIKVPQYQRELAWDFEKMQKLWDDMFLHCQIKDPRKAEDPFFIGALIKATHDDHEIIDGQQRLSSLKVIASGIRDALIATGYHDEAWKVQKNILYEYVNHGPRLVPLDHFPIAKPDLSNKMVLEPYHKIITPVFSGYKLVADAIVGATALDTDPVTASWTATTTKLYIYNDGKKVSEVNLTAPFTFTKGHAIVPITTCDPLLEGLNIGDEIWISPDTKWTEDKNEQDKYVRGVHEFYNRDFRMLYLSVRAQSEHFILEDKQYKTVGRLDRTRAKSANLNPLNEHHLHLIGNAPTSVVFEDSVPNSGTFKFGDDKWYGVGPKDSIFPPKKVTGEFDPTPASSLTKGATTDIKYAPVVSPYSGHNADPGRRASTLSHLIRDVWLIDVEFDGPTKSQPIDHFLNTNDRSKMSPLVTLDLLNALVNKITENPDPGGHDPFSGQRAIIVAKWKLLWDRLYLDLDKDPKHAEDFFYQWMMASKRWNGKSRYREYETFKGIQKIWKDSKKLYNSNGTYNVVYLQKEFKEMEMYSYFYAQAIYPSTFPGTTGRHHKQRQFLYILKTIGKQWLPPYLAMRYLAWKKGTTVGDALVVTNDFLKNIITLYLKHNFYGKRLNANGPRGTDVGGKFSPNEIYGKMLGVSDGTDYRWIGEIHRVFKRGTIAPLDQGIVKDLPKSVVDGKTVPEWIIGDPLRKYVSGDVKPFVMAFESILTGTADPIGWDTAEVEHVLPKNASRWGALWWGAGGATLLHDEHLEMLGNKCLIGQQRNIHVTKSSFDGKKIPGPSATHHAKDCSVAGCAKHYNTAIFPSITAVSPDGVRGNATWDNASIVNRTEHMMDKIIQEFDF